MWPRRRASASSSTSALACRRRTTRTRWPRRPPRRHGWCTSTTTRSCWPTRALLTSSQEGATAYLDANIKDTAAILAGAADVLDFSQPVAVMLVAVLHMLRDEEDPGDIVTRLMSAVPPGSFLVVSHLASDVQTETMAEMRRRLNESMTQQFTMRTRAEVTRFFDGLRLVDPGVVLTHEWRQDGAEESATPGVLWAGVAEKP
ncbi:MAG: SAM-dependent methyltransferase [Trebonia sp.]